MICICRCEFCNFESPNGKICATHEFKCELAHKLVDCLSGEWNPGQINKIKMWDNTDKIELLTRVLNFFNDHYKQRDKK